MRGQQTIQACRLLQLGDSHVLQNEEEKKTSAKIKNKDYLVLDGVLFHVQLKMEKRRETVLLIYANVVVLLYWAPFVYILMWQYSLFCIEITARFS